MLQCLPIKTLNGLSKYVKWEEKDEEDDKPPSHSKPVLVKKIFQTMEEIGAKKFLEKVDSTTINSALKALDLENSPDDTKADKVSKILVEADEIGLENCFSSFPVSALQEFCDACNLEVNTQSQTQLITCLLNQEDYEPPVKKSAKISSKKPTSIKKGISKANLQHWFNRKELEEWCEDHNLTKTGNKSVLINRIINKLEGKEEPKKKTRKRKASTNIGNKRTKRAKRSKNSSDEGSTSESEGKKKSKKEQKSSDSEDDKSEESSAKEDKTKDKKKEREKMDVSEKEESKKEKEKEKEKDKEKEKAKEKAKEKERRKSKDKEGSEKSKGSDSD